MPIFYEKATFCNVKSENISLIQIQHQPRSNPLLLVVAFTKMSQKFIHNFCVIQLSDRQTDRQTVAVLGRGLGFLTFCPGPPVFPPTTYYCPPHMVQGGPPPTVLARTATADRQTHRQTQTDRQRGRQTDTQTDRHTNRRTDKDKDIASTVELTTCDYTSVVCRVLSEAVHNTQKLLVTS